MGDATLAGMSVLVTGASRGIGLAISAALAASEAWVGMVARRSEPLTRAAEQVGGHPFPADVSSPEDVERLQREVRSRLGGPPDAVVNAAGAFSLGALVETSPDELTRQLDANVRGPFQVIRAFLPGMLERGSGHIVNIGSIAGRVPLPGNAAYGASKYALRGLHEILALEVTGTGIRMTLVEPAATDTPLWDPVDPDSREDLPSRSAMLRPEDVARAVVFALSQPAGVEVSYLAIRATS